MTDYIREGARWYITIGNSAKVKDVTVVSFTDTTVLLGLNDFSLDAFGIMLDAPKERFVFDKITWLEKVRK
jgi:hypothetical protein